MAMLDPSSRDADRRAGLMALWVIGGISLLMVLMLAAVIVYSMWHAM